MHFLRKGCKLSHFRLCLFKFQHILTQLRICFFFCHIFNLYADERDNIALRWHECVCLCDSHEAYMCVSVFVPWCTSMHGHVSVHRYCSLERVCMSTTLDRACEGLRSMCVLLSVQSPLRQQGAPFQFAHQPQRRGVKARGIAVGDFTFRGRDYLSGDPCVEVMREGGCRGTVWGSWDWMGDRGSGERREGSTTKNLPEICGFSVFWGALLPSFTSV